MTTQQGSGSLEKFLFGAILGGVIGAAFGVLMAPKSGSETRQTLMDQAQTKVDESLKKLNEGKEVVRSKVDESVSQIQDVSGQLKSRAQEISGKLAQAGQQAVQVLKSSDKPANGNGQAVEAEAGASSENNY